MENICIKAEPQETVACEDVPLYFTEQELASLRLDEKALYKEVVLENFLHLAFLGGLAAEKAAGPEAAGAGVLPLAGPVCSGCHPLSPRASSFHPRTWSQGASGGNWRA